MKHTYMPPVSEVIKIQAEELLAQSGGYQTFSDDSDQWSRKRDKSAWDSGNWSGEAVDDDEDL